MTKKILVLIVILMFAGILIPQQKKLVTSHVYLKDYPEVLIGESDLYCSYEIVKRINRDLKIISSAEIDTNKSQYTTSDIVFINKGSAAGLKDGDKFIIFSVVKKIYRPGTLKFLGRLIQKKGTGTIVELKERSASLKLELTCTPIHIGDNLIPFKSEEKVVKRSVDYSRSAIPDSLPHGEIIYSSDFSDINRVSHNTGNIVVSNLGIGEVSKGDFVLFYRILKKSLPRIIIGSGIVLKPQNSNSTIKIIDSSLPIHIGEQFAVLPPVKETVPGKNTAPPLDKKK